jgi:hypothetical protein
MGAGPGRFLKRERSDLTVDAISNGELSVNEMRLWLISVAVRGRQSCLIVKSGAGGLQAPAPQF